MMAPRLTLRSSSFVLKRGSFSVLFFIVAISAGPRGDNTTREAAAATAGGLYRSKGAALRALAKSSL